MHEARLALAPAAHRVDELHPSPADLLEVEDLYVQAVLLGELLGRRGEALRVDDVGRLVAEVAREVHRGPDALPHRHQSLRVRLETGRDADRDALERALRLPVAGE